MHTVFDCLSLFRLTFAQSPSHEVFLSPFQISLFFLICGIRAFLMTSGIE